MPAVPVLLVLSALGASLGTLGGLGGAIFLVPALVFAGVSPEIAVPLGAVTVVAGSLAAGPSQLASGLVHHRLGVSIEVIASAGAIGGAIVGNLLADDVLARLLGVVALGGALFAARRGGMRNLPSPIFSNETPGEWPGTFGGAYRLGREVVPYQARRITAGLSAMLGAGVMSGIAGVGGGFVKVPVMREVMHVPVKVATATSTFTVGVTAAVSLLVYAGQGRVEVQAAAAVIIGAVAGGLLGARVQALLDPVATRRVLAVLLGAVAIVLLVRG